MGATTDAVAEAAAVVTTAATVDSATDAADRPADGKKAVVVSSVNRERARSNLTAAAGRLRARPAIRMRIAAVRRARGAGGALAVRAIAASPARTRVATRKGLAALGPVASPATLRAVPTVAPEAMIPAVAAALAVRAVAAAPVDRAAAAVAPAVLSVPAAAVALGALDQGARFIRCR